MSGLALATLVAVCSVVWGGFALFLGRAMRHERRRAREDGR